MRRTLACLLIIFGPLLSFAQRPGGFRETTEPPLADSATGLRLTSGTGGAPNLRVADATAPLVQLNVRAPKTAIAGKEVELVLVVENLSRAPAKNVLVINPLPTGATFNSANPMPSGQAAEGVFWKLDSMPGGTRREIVLKYTPAPGQVEIENKARITYEHENSTRVKVAKPEVKIRKSGPEQASRFDMLVFVIDVVNSGAAELTDLKVIDTLPEGLTHAGDPERGGSYSNEIAPASTTTPDKRARTWTIARLGPGQTRRIEYYVAANQVGTFPHSANIVGVEGLTSSQSQVVVGEPKLELKAEASPREQANQPARLAVRVTNRGTRTMTNVVVTDKIRNDCILDNISAGGQQFENLVQWIVPSLGPGETKLLELAVRSPKTGQVGHEIIGVYRGLSVQATAQTEFEATAVLAWEFRGSPTTLTVNQEVTYAVMVRNNGSLPATNVKPTVLVPKELPLSRSPQPAGALAEPGKVVFEPVTIPPGGRATFTVTCRAQEIGESRAVAELAADVYTTGPVRKQELTVVSNAQPILPPPPPATTSPIGSTGMPLVRPAPPPSNPY